VLVLAHFLLSPFFYVPHSSTSLLKTVESKQETVYRILEKIIFPFILPVYCLLSPVSCFYILWLDP
jgi:hypothetical protein